MQRLTRQVGLAWIWRLCYAWLVQKDQCTSSPLDELLAPFLRYAGYARRNMGRLSPALIRLSATTLEARTCGHAPAPKKEPRS